MQNSGYHQIFIFRSGYETNTEILSFFDYLHFICNNINIAFASYLLQWMTFILMLGLIIKFAHDTISYQFHFRNNQINYHNNNLRQLYPKQKVYCHWWIDAVYDEASHQHQDLCPPGQEPSSQHQAGWRCCQPRPQAATGTGPADTWQPLHSTGHTPSRTAPAPAPAGEDVVMAGLV